LAAPQATLARPRTAERSPSNEIPTLGIAARDHRNLFITPQPALARSLEPLPHLRLREPFVEMGLYGFPNHLQLLRAIVCSAEVDEVIG